MAVTPPEATFRIDGRKVGAAEIRQLFAAEHAPDRMVRALAHIEGRTVLDIGCYGGTFVRRALDEDPSLDVIGTDYDAESVRIARAAHPEIADRFSVASVYALERDDASVDCVVLQEVIEHLEGAGAAVKEINRVLRTGGALIVTTPTPYYWRDALDFVRAELRNRLRPAPRLSTAMFEASTEWNRHIHCWTPSTLLTLLEVNGFAYDHHEYSADAGNRWERLLFRAFPFVGPVVVLKVRKVSDAPTRVV